MTPPRAARPSKPPAAPSLAARIAALRSQPRKFALLVAAGAAVVVLLGVAWATRGTETWITAAPADMRLSVGASQQMSVALMYKPRFRFRGSARPIAGTIQLVSFPEAVDVSPTSIVTSEGTPEATLKVTALRPGREELTLAASNRPKDERSWQTTSVSVVVVR